MGEIGIAGPVPDQLGYYMKVKKQKRSCQNENLEIGGF
jgi:hypothetical protein